MDTKEIKTIEEILRSRQVIVISDIVAGRLVTLDRSNTLSLWRCIAPGEWRLAAQKPASDLKLTLPTGLGEALELLRM